MFIPFYKQERLRDKAGVLNTNLPSSKYGPSIKADLAVSKALTATERSEISEPIVSSSSAKLSAPLFTKKVKSSDRVKFGKQKTDGDQTTNLEDGW